MPDIARTLRAAALAACAVVAAGCGPASSPAPGLPASSPSATARSSPGPGGTVTGDPREQVLGAYTGMWDAYAVAARTAGYQPGPLSRFAAGDALAVLTRSLYDFHQNGVVARGAPVLHPQVTAMSPVSAPGTSAVTDCADDTRWLQYTTSGKPASGTPAGRHRIYARLRLFGTGWKVTSVVVEKAGTC